MAKEYPKWWLTKFDRARLIKSIKDCAAADPQGTCHGFTYSELLEWVLESK